LIINNFLGVTNIYKGSNLKENYKAKWTQSQ